MTSAAARRDWSFSRSPKKEVPAASRLLLTSRVNDDAVQSAVKDRLVYRYITKPWLTEDLSLTLKTAVDTFRLAEKNTSLTLEKNDLERTVRDLEKVVASGGGKGGGGAAVVQATQTGVVAGDGDAGTIMQTMIEMLYVFHPNLKSNAMRTMALVKTVAETLQMEKLAGDSLYQAAALHDIAIPGVDRPIIRRWLRDPEKCNKDEMKIIEQHPNHAIEMLKPYPMFKEAEPTMRIGTARATPTGSRAKPSRSRRGCCAWRWTSAVNTLIPSWPCWTSRNSPANYTTRTPFEPSPRRCPSPRCPSASAKSCSSS